MKTLKCAVSLHPAHHGMIEALGEDEAVILDAAKRVPQVRVILRRLHVR